MHEAGRQLFKANMLKRLQKRPWIADHCTFLRICFLYCDSVIVVLPDFGPGCRRLAPGPGYLEALCEDNVEFIPTHVKRVTATGIETVDGKHEELDVIICATGSCILNLPFDLNSCILRRL